MNKLELPTKEEIYTRSDSFVIFNQLGVKITLDNVTNREYFSWLDSISEEIGNLVLGGKIAEKVNSRIEPTLNTAIYYDTADYDLLNTGALLRTSCNKITHAFCAFKMPSDNCGIRKDHRSLFADLEKETIQKEPDSKKAVYIVKKLLASNSPNNPGLHLKKNFNIDPCSLLPAVRLDNQRYSFYVWLDNEDALRCSLDIVNVKNLRSKNLDCSSFSEVEISIYPRISKKISEDIRTVELIKACSTSLVKNLNGAITDKIKYQRAIEVLKNEN